MQRRDVVEALAGIGLLTGQPAAAAPNEAPAPQPAPQPARPPTKPIVLALVYPKMILLDLNGPQTVLAIAGCDVRLVGKTLDPVATDVGIPVRPSVTMADAPRDPDVLFVPGGLEGTTALMDDPATLEFLADVGGRARIVTGVCTGTLLLAAAGLLRGYRATSHWYVRDLLPTMGAVLDPERVVIDRNRMTGGGVTSGIDLALSIAATLRGEASARFSQLLVEYAPQPPFPAGSPEGAGPELTQSVLKLRAPALAMARDAAERAGQRLRG